MSATNKTPIYAYTLLFGSSDHLQGNVFHTVPGKKRKQKKKTQNYSSSRLKKN